MYWQRFVGAMPSTLGFMTLKLATGFLIGRLSRHAPGAAVRLAFALPAGGEFAFVLFALGVRHHVLDFELSEQLVIAVTLSMALSPLLLTLYDFVATRIKEPEAPFDSIEERDSRVIIAGYGRFNHEAACVDPQSSIAYLTEDRADGCLYRFVPRDRERPFEGQLQALVVRGSPRHATSEDLRVGARLPVSWIVISDPTPETDSVRDQAHERGAASFRRGEGIWRHAGKIYFVATSGGPAGAGQIFRLDPSTGNLELIAQSEDGESFDGPDNLAVAPWGDVIVAEDGSGDNFIRGVTPQGRVYDIARNARSGGELAGVCFSPDGTAMFCNLQHEGVYVAVTGPLESIGHRA